MSRTHLIRWVMVLVVAGCIAAPFVVSWRHTRLAASRSVILPGGTTIEYLGTVHGTGQFTTDKPWMRLARNHLPASFTRRLPPATTGSCGYDSNGVTVYLRVTPVPAGSAPWSHYEAVDDSGFAYGRGGGHCSFGAQSGSVVYGLILRAYPRRQNDFVFRLLDRQQHHLAELRLPNPVRGPFPRWQPRPLPQSQTNGPLVLTLKSLRLHVGENYRHVASDWDFASADPAWQHPRHPYPEFSDATGNSGSVLSFEEPAWKLRAMVHRERSEDFAPQERLVITNLPVPEPMTLYQPGVQGECAGTTVALLAVSAGGRLAMTNEAAFGLYSDASSGSGSMSSSSLQVAYWSEPGPFALVMTRGMSPRDDLQLEAVDDQGKRSKLNWHSTQSSGSTVRRAVALKLSPGAKRFDLEIRISRPLEFEFMVDPADIQKGDKP